MTSNERTTERRIAGIKAKRLRTAGETNQYIKKNGRIEPRPVIFVISTEKNRIINILKPIVQKAGKHIELTGEELYRQSLTRRTGDISNRVVTLIITDQPDDHHAVGRSEIPLWQEAIAVYQNDYLEGYAEDIEKNLVPENLTVITIFKTKQGKLSDEEVKVIDEEFKAYQEKINVKHVQCESEEELANVVDKDVVGMFLERFRKTEGLRRFERSRGQKLAKAQKATKDARRKLLSS